MTKKRQIPYKVWLGLGLALVLALLVWFALSGDNAELLKSLFTEELSNDELSRRLQSFGPRGYITVTVLAALQIVCTVFPAAPLQVLAGFAFGFFKGLLCCVVGVLFGNSLIFWLQKMFGDRLRGFFVKKLNVDLEKTAASSKGVLLVFLLFLVPIVPYGMICFLAAAMGMSYRRYMTVTTLGTLPAMVFSLGLGRMLLTLHWTAMALILAVLIVLVVLLFLKKDMLLEKLCGQAKKTPPNAVRPMNTWLMTVVYGVVRCYYFLCGIRVKTIRKVKAPVGPAIVLCNHGSFIDFIYAAALIRNVKPHFIVARLYFYNKWLSWLLRRLGAFPKSMFATDLESTKNCLAVLRNDEVLAMMPEARLSTVGRFEDIQENTFSFLKKAGVAVYTVKFGGDYFADPKWGKGFRRGAVVEAELDSLYTAEQVKALSVEEIRQGVHDRLFYDEFAWLAQHPNVHYRCSRMAEGLENILTTCPVCHGKYTLFTKKNRIFCEQCGELTTLDDRYHFAEGFCFSTPAQWYDRQKEQLALKISKNKAFCLSSKVELRLPAENGKGLTRHGGYGVCTLNREGLVYEGTMDGETVTLSYSLQRVYRLLFGAGENFEIYDGTQIRYFVPTEKRSAVEWYLASMILYDEEVTG